VFLNRLNGESIGYTLVGIIVIDKNAILTVLTTHRLFSSALYVSDLLSIDGKSHTTEVAISAFEILTGHERKEMRYDRFTCIRKDTDIIRRAINQDYKSIYTVSQIKGATLVFVITFTVVKLFAKYLKLVTSHVFLHLLMYSNCPPHLNYMRPLYRAKTITIKLDNYKHFAETIQQYHA